MDIIDPLDEHLIRLLEKNARQSSETLSKQLNVSAATIRRRLRRLVQSGVMRIAALVDPNKVGFPVTALMAFNIEHANLELYTQLLAEQLESVWVSTTTGRFNLLCLASFRSTDHLADFMLVKWADAKAVKDTEVFVSLQVKKGRYRQI